MFTGFIDTLQKRLESPLPGEEAQYLMAPLSRIKAKEFAKNYLKPKKSAVLILLFPENDILNTVFIKRPEYPGVHSGQIAFPGGKFEKTDKNLQETALRETHEEIGVSPNTVKVVGQLTDLYINPSNFLVSPFIGYTPERPNFIIDNHEVDDIITYDLLDLGNEKLVSKKEIKLSIGLTLKTPYYDIKGHTVWGATAMIISELNAVMKSLE